MKGLLLGGLTVVGVIGCQGLLEDQALAAPAAKERYEFVASKGEDSYYIDRQSVRRTGNQVRFSVATPVGQSNETGVLLTQFTGNCQSRYYKQLASYSVNRFGTTKIGGVLTSERALKDTIAGDILTRACAPR